MTAEAGLPLPEPIIDHVPSAEELRGAAPAGAELATDAGAIAQLGEVGMAGLVETPITDGGYEELPSIPRPSVAQETARQMMIAAADRTNRKNAGLPPRTFDLR